MPLEGRTKKIRGGKNKTTTPHHPMAKTFFEKQIKWLTFVLQSGLVEVTQSC